MLRKDGNLKGGIANGKRVKILRFCRFWRQGVYFIVLEFVFEVFLR